MAKALVTLVRKRKGERQEIELGLSGTLVTCEDLLRAKYWAADCPGFLLKIPERAYKCIREIEETPREIWERQKDYLDGDSGALITVDAGVCACKIILHDEKRAKELGRKERNIALEATQIKLKNIKAYRKPGAPLEINFVDAKRKLILKLEILGSVK